MIDYLIKGKTITGDYYASLIKNSKVSKVFAKDLSARNQLSKLKTECGSIVSGTPEILSEIERFYGQLYTSSLEPHASVSNDPRESLIRHYSVDNPDVIQSKIRMALQHLKNGKSPGEDGITAELLKAGGKPVLEILQKFFNSVLHGDTTPEVWSRSLVLQERRQRSLEELQTDFPSEPRLRAVFKSH